MEEQKMSSQERIYNNILSIQEEIQSLDTEIAKVETCLKKDGLPSDEKKVLEEELQALLLDRGDLTADLAMLEELLTKMEIQDQRSSYDEDDGGSGLDWNESGYFD